MGEQYTLNSTDMKKVGVGALVAVVGALLTYGTQTFTTIDFGSYTPLAVSVFSILANLARKFLTKTK